MTDLQSLVDGLASEIGRPVGVDDRRFRSLAYSSHVDELDQVRLSSILQRQAPSAVTEFLESLDIAGAEHYVRVDANPALGMLARVCVPLRFAGSLLGYVWLFDEPEPLHDEELARALRFAEEASAAIYRLQRLETADRQQEREMLGCLLGLRHGNADKRASALETLELLATAAHHFIVVLTARSSAGGVIDDTIRVRLANACEQLRRTSLPHSVVVLPAGDTVVCLLSIDAEPALALKLDILLERAMAALTAVPHWSPLIGASSGLPGLARAGDAYRQALAAVRMANLDPQFRPIARWDDLGASRTIIKILGDSDAHSAIPPSFRRLVESSDAPALVPTLEQWLDHAGDTQLAAQALFIHRSSLYNRLHRIESICGVELSSGDSRLELHLGLRLWALAGGRERLGAPRIQAERIGAAP